MKACLFVLEMRIFPCIIEEYVDHNGFDLFMLEKFYVGKSSNNILCDARLQLIIGKISIPMALLKKVILVSKKKMFTAPYGLVL